MSARLLVCLAWLALSATPLLASLDYANDFTGDSSTMWGWNSMTDTNGQLGGTNEMVYSFTASNADSWVQQPITDTSIFPDGTGTVTVQLTVDLSNWTSGTSDFSTTALAEIGSAGNKSAFTGGKISNIGFAGWNDPGAVRFGVANAIVWYNNAGSNTGTAFVGTDPSFALIYDLVWTTTITGDDASGWDVASTLDATGPINSAGDIGVLHAETNFSRVYSSFDGWGSATSYRVGISPGGNSLDPGESVVFDDFIALTIPEPATLSLLALGGVALLRRRKR